MHIDNFRLHSPKRENITFSDTFHFLGKQNSQFFSLRSGSPRIGFETIFIFNLNKHNKFYYCHIVLNR